MRSSRRDPRFGARCHSGSPARVVATTHASAIVSRVSPERIRLGFIPSTICLMGVVAAMTTASVARADEAMAESLFRAATDLASAGDYVAACPKFAESQRESPANGTLVALGNCYRKLGKTASAWATYKELAATARKSGDAARSEAAAAMAGQLERELSKLTVRAEDGDIRGLSVTRDGEEMGVAALGTAIAVDPGEHVIVASAPDHEAFRVSVTIGPSGDAKTIVIPTLARSGDASSSRRTAGWILGGAGLAATGVGAVLGIVTLSQSSTIKHDAALCGTGECTRKGDQATSSAQAKGWAATFALPVGLAALGAGVTLVLTSRQAGATQQSVGLGFRASPVGGDAAVSWQF
jgi:hypothetical protein